jgi:uncharacterized protein YoaH (UPF0181 family)
VNQKFADAVRKLETEEARFAVGLASVRAVDEAVMAALQVATKAAGDQKAANAAADQAAAERAAMTESTLKMLRSQLEDTRLRLERTNELVAQGLAAPADLDQLKILLKNLELKLQAAQQSAETEQKRAAVTKAQFLDYTADVAKLNIEEAQLKLERTQKLVAEGVVSSQAVQEAELAVQRAKYALSLKQIEARPDVALSAPAAALRDRILREGATLSDEALIGVLKDAGKLTGDTDRAEVLLAFARQQTMTPEMATLFVAAAGGIKSDDERARVFKQPVRLRQGKGK